MNPARLSVSLCLMSSLMVACGDPGDDGGDPQKSSEMDLVMHSVTLSGVVSSGNNKAIAPGPLPRQAALSSIDASQPVNNSAAFVNETKVDCTVAITNSLSKNGQCLTPYNISGHTSSVNASGTATANGPSRLLGGADNPDGSILSYYDLRQAVPIDGEDNLEDATPGGYYDSISIDYFNTDVRVKLGDEYWTVRYVHVGQPVTQESEIASCLTDADVHLRNRFDEMYFYSSLAMQRRDVLLCVTENAGDICADDDFFWLDTSSDTFVSTRPSQPYQFDIAYDPVCNVDSQERSGYSMDTGPMQLAAKVVDDNAVNSTFTLTGEFPENSQYKWYTFSKPGVAMQEGNNIDVKLDFTFNEGVFVDETAILAESSVADWEQAPRSVLLKNIHLKPFLVWEHYLSQGMQPPYGEEPHYDVKVSAEFGPNFVDQDDSVKQ